MINNDTTTETIETTTEIDGEATLTMLESTPTESTNKNTPVFNQTVNNLTKTNKTTITTSTTTTMKTTTTPMVETTTEYIQITTVIPTTTEQDFDITTETNLNTITTNIPIANTKRPSTRGDTSHEIDYQTFHTTIDKEYDSTTEKLFPIKNITEITTPTQYNIIYETTTNNNNNNNNIPPLTDMSNQEFTTASVIYDVCGISNDCAHNEICKDGRCHKLCDPNDPNSPNTNCIQGIICLFV